MSISVHILGGTDPGIIVHKEYTILPFIPFQSIHTC